MKFHKMFLFCTFLSMISVTLLGCGEKRSNSSQAEPQTLGEAIKQLEKEGKYPVLDRTDTLAGIDNDGNGVRDDIDAYIQSRSLTNDQKSALTQYAYSINYQMLPGFDMENPNHLNEMFYIWGKADNCLLDYFNHETIYETKPIVAFTFNTKKRYEFNAKMSKKLSGMSWRSQKEGCDEKFFNK